MDPASLGPAPSSVLVVDVGANTISPYLFLSGKLLRRRVERALRQELQMNRGPCRITVLNWVRLESFIAITFRLSVGRPHAWDRFRISIIMDEKEHRKIIVIGKHLEETRVEQVFQEVLRSNASVPSEWEFSEETLAKAHDMVRERLKIERERCRVEGAILELRSVLEATRAELDERRNDIEGIFLAKQDLERALAKATTKVDDLCLQKLSAEAGHSREEVSRLSFELSAVRAKAATAREEALQFLTELVTLRSEVEALHACSVDPDISGESSCTELEVVRGEVSVPKKRESELLDESEVAQAKAMTLQSKLETSQAAWSAFKWPCPRGISRATSIDDVRSSSVLTIPKVGVAWSAGSCYVEFAQGLPGRLGPAMSSLHRGCLVG
ncbi:hypothetical protein ACLOJK_023160 [Asimina triloba]